MARLPAFDYRRPFFYMVTLTGSPEAPLQNHPFSALAPDGRIQPNALTEAFGKVLREFPKQWPWIASLSPHAIMPDHLHLLVKLGAPPPAHTALEAWPTLPPP